MLEGTLGKRFAVYAEVFSLACVREDKIKLIKSR